MKTSLGIWAFGATATRFNPGGYKPELAASSTADRVRTAVGGLGDLRAAQQRKDAVAAYELVYAALGA